MSFWLPLLFVHNVNINFCRTTNYELLHWLVETPSTASSDIRHYRMLNVLAVDSSTYFNVEPSTSSTFKTFIVTIILLPSTSSNADRFQNSCTCINYVLQCYCAKQNAVHYSDFYRGLIFLHWLQAGQGPQILVVALVLRLALSIALAAVELCWDVCSQCCTWYNRQNATVVFVAVSSAKVTSCTKPEVNKATQWHQKTESPHI